MKTIEFKYTDAKDRVTNRLLAVLSEPSEKYFGIDLSELDEQTAGEIIAELVEARAYHRAELEQIMYKYDLKSNFRYFFANRMENVTHETY